MKFLLGLLLIFTGIAIGFYVGFYLMFIGGLVSFIDGVKSDPVDSYLIAIGIAKFFFSGLSGLMTFALFFIPGSILIELPKQWHN
ncbi:MAG: hypothetical protein WAO78_15245 [Roseovarius sp.]